MIADAVETSAAGGLAVLGLPQCLWTGSVAAVGDLLVQDGAVAPGVICDEDRWLALSGDTCQVCGRPVRIQLDWLLRFGIVVCDGPVAGLPGRRIQDPGPRAPPGGRQGHPGRRLQPQRRRQRDGADSAVPRPGQPLLLQPDRAAGSAGLLHELHGLWQQPSVRKPGGHQASNGLTALLGRGDACRWIPLRSGVSAGPG